MVTRSKTSGAHPGAGSLRRQGDRRRVGVFREDDLRDLAVLELAGVPWFFDHEERCSRLRPGHSFPAINLGDDELIGQATASTLTSAPGLDVTKGAGPTTRKLRATSREDAARLLAEVEAVTSVLDLKLADHSGHHESTRTIQWTLIEGPTVSHLVAPKPGGP